MSRYVRPFRCSASAQSSRSASGPRSGGTRLCHRRDRGRLAARRAAARGVRRRSIGACCEPVATGWPDVSRRQAILESTRTAGRAPRPGMGSGNTPCGAALLGRGCPGLTAFRQTFALVESGTVAQGDLSSALGCGESGDCREPSRRTRLLPLRRLRGTGAVSLSGSRERGFRALTPCDLRCDLGAAYGWVRTGREAKFLHSGGSRSPRLTPLLTIEQQGGNGGQGREVAGTKDEKKRGFVQRRVIARGRQYPRWCSLRFPKASRLRLGVSTLAQVAVEVRFVSRSSGST